MQNMYNAKINSPITLLVNDITDIQTTIELVDASVLPPAPNLLTISAGKIEDDETCLYTDITDNVVTVTRGFESPAKAWLAGNYVARVFTAYDHNTFKVNLETLYGIYNKVQDPTGFRYPDDVIVNYDSTSRRVTLTGDVELLYKGLVVEDMIPNWESPQHPENPTTNLFLSFNGTEFLWSTSPWSFVTAQIAILYYESNGTFRFGIRESHGLMPWQNHQAEHYNTGTYRRSDGGGDLDPNSFVLNSNVAANRRPDITECSIWDEDLKTVLPALTTKSYTQLSLTGTTSSLVWSTAQSDFIALSGNSLPFYNEWNGTTWLNTELPNNRSMSVWVIAIPVTSDAQSQLYRFVFMRGQSISTTTALELEKSPSSLNLGALNSLSPEFTFIAQIVLRRSGNDWSINTTVSLFGSRAFFSGSQGAFLSAVSASQVSYSGTVSNLDFPNVQDAIDNSILYSEVTPYTADHTLVYTDKNKVVVMSKTGEATLTIPTNDSVAFPLGTVIKVYNTSASYVFIVGDTGVTVRNKNRIAQYKEMTLRKRGTNEWVIEDWVLSPWLDPVASFSNIATTYTNPDVGNVVLVTDNFSIYSWDGTVWYKINRGKISRFSEFNKNTTQSIATGTLTLVSWNTVITDSHGFYSAGTPTRFTVPSGISYVRITAHVSMDTLRRDRLYYLLLRLNGTDVAQYSTAFPNGVGDSAWVFSLTSKVFAVTSGDYFEVLIFQNSGNAVNILNNSLTYCNIEVLV